MVGARTGASVSWSYGIYRRLRCLLGEVVSRVAGRLLLVVLLRETQGRQDV